MHATASIARPHASRPRPAVPAAAPAAAKVETVAPGSSLFLQGEAAESYFEVVSGTVRCCGLTEDGRRQIFRFASSGALLGLGGGDVHTHSAEAVTVVTVRRHRLAALDAAMATDRGLRERVVGALRDELDAVRTQTMLLGRMTAAERIAAFLRDLLSRSRSPDGSIQLTMTRGDIADYLGLTLETVSRKINELNRLGAIELSQRSRVRIPDLRRLDALAAAA